MEAFANKTDEELIREMREQKNQIALEIMDFLMEKYKYLVRKRANAMFLVGGDTDDLIQEGMIGLFKAVRDYRLEENVSFFYFADLCITRQIYTAVEAAGRQKHAPLNSYVSFWTQESEKGGFLMDVLQDEEQENPENLIIAQENYKQLVERIRGRLSRMEREVLDFYLSGMNYRQIAEKMGKSSKTIDNALQRIKNKIQQEVQ